MRSIRSSSLLHAGQLRLGLEPVGELVDRFTSMRNSVLLDFGHLGECLAFVLEADVPCWISSVHQVILWKRSVRKCTEIRRPTRRHDLALPSHQRSPFKQLEDKPWSDPGRGSAHGRAQQSMRMYKQPQRPCSRSRPAGCGNSCSRR